MKKSKHNADLIILLALFIIYLVVLFKTTIFRDTNSGILSVNLIPFETISKYLGAALGGIRIIGVANLLGNLILFFPLGYMTASLFPKMRKLKRALILALGFSVAIEIVQYVFSCGAADIDDVILNTLGAVIGYWVYALGSRFLKSKKYAIFISMLIIAVTCIGFYSFDNYKFLIDRPSRGELPTLTNMITIGSQANAHLSTDETTADIQNNIDADALYGDEAAWYLILVNKWNHIPDDYDMELTELSNGQSVDKRIYPALQKMLDAARSDGVYPVVVSGYRTAKEQQSLLDNKITGYRTEGYSAEEAKTKAEAWVAISGTSEHQLGIAVDINADGIHSVGYEVYEWLNQNSYKFGFICRYPTDKTEITGVINEPWHYRYVGTQAATEIYNQGVCLEEYLNMVN